MRIFMSLINPIIFCGLLLILSVPHPALSQTYWTGDGGRGMSITVLTPQAIGLVEGLEYLPVLVQGELINNFTTYSAIEVFNREVWEKQQVELMSERYNESAEALVNVGRRVPTQYFLGGSITRTASGYALQLSVIETAGNNTTVATYSGTSTFQELDNFIGVRRASLDLLQKMGVALTEQGKTALAGAATENHVSAQAALSRGIVAQRQGTEVAALSYFYQAAAFDPKLAEAVNRSTVMAANISSANLGENIRNDIVWRRDWVARLKETEEVFHQMISSADPPYTLFYSTGIEAKDINYQAETADLSIPVNLTANEEWFAAMQRVLQAADEVLKGLNATNRKNDWQLRGWPSNGVSNNNPFGYKYWRHDITVDFELVDQQGRVIGRQTASLNPSFNINCDNNKFTVNFTKNTQSTVTFRTVRADDISDNLTIRPASVNGNPPEMAQFPISAISAERREQNIFLQIENGVVTGFNRSLSAEQRARYRNLVIPAEAWGQPVTAIAARAFENSGLVGVTIPNSVRTIGERAFANNRLTSIIIGGGVTSIRERAFESNRLTSVTISDNVTTIGSRAFFGNEGIRSVTIGANVGIADGAFSYIGKRTDGTTGVYDMGFVREYQKRRRRAGTYTLAGFGWGLAETGRRREGTMNVVAYIGVAVAAVCLVYVLISAGSSEGQ